MLKQLLKYEFKATKSLYFGLYLALALLSVVLGVTFRQEHALAHSTSFQNLEVILMIVYVSVILAIAVLCFVNTIQRFYQNLLGREGYLMHTLPVNENQLHPLQAPHQHGLGAVQRPCGHRLHHGDGQHRCD